MEIGLHYPPADGFVQRDSRGHAGQRTDLINACSRTCWRGASMRRDTMALERVGGGGDPCSQYRSTGSGSICRSSILNPHEFIGGFDRLAIACVNDD
jgi:hypothetical protein